MRAQHKARAYGLGPTGLGPRPVPALLIDLKFSLRGLRATTRSGDVDLAESQAYEVANT